MLGRDIILARRNPREAPKNPKRAEKRSQRRPRLRTVNLAAPAVPRTTKTPTSRVESLDDLVEFFVAAGRRRASRLTATRASAR